MSVERLEALIAQLSVDIDLQKEVLRQLENQKNAAQRQLNAIRDPVARLPLEISSQIFLQSLPSARPKPDPCAVPMLLLNVCNAWTDIALSTPALWAAVHLDCQGAEILRSWLRRARRSSLSISLRKSLDDGVTTILWEYANQIKHLEFHEEEHDVRSLPSLPCLQTLTIGSPLGDADHLNELSFEHVMGLLHLTPNLVECKFHNISTGIRLNTPEDLILPSLRCVKFGAADPENPHGGDDLLRYLSLPALEELVVPLVDIARSEFTLFLKRSLPPLRRLVLGCRHIDFSFIQLDEWLRPLSSLSDLELYTCDGPFASDLFSALANSTSELLPNLRSLKMQNYSPNPIPFFHEKVLLALSARRPQLVHFHLTTDGRPHPDVRDRLRQLAIDGMEIYIGDGETNYMEL